MFLTKLAYVLRGLSLERTTGELRGRGCIKASWIAEHFGLSLRAVRLARSELIESGFIEKDVASFQRKLNRDGSYFEINLARYAGTLKESAGTIAESAGIVVARNINETRRVQSVPAQSTLPVEGTGPAHSNSDSAGILRAATGRLTGRRTPGIVDASGEGGAARFTWDCHACEPICTASPRKQPPICTP